MLATIVVNWPILGKFTLIFAIGLSVLYMMYYAYDRYEQKQNDTSKVKTGAVAQSSSWEDRAQKELLPHDEEAVANAVENGVSPKVAAMAAVLMRGTLKESMAGNKNAVNYALKGYWADENKLGHREDFELVLAGFLEEDQKTLRNLLDK